MKEMEYLKEHLCIVLDKGQFNGLNYCIVSYGVHPCAYVFIPKEHKFYGKNYDEIEISVHGGLTYSDNDLQFNPIVSDFWVIGWDYAHCGDYAGYYEKDNYFYNKTKRWTTKEILEEVKDVIKQLGGINE